MQNSIKSFKVQFLNFLIVVHKFARPFFNRYMTCGIKNTGNQIQFVEDESFRCGKVEDEKQRNYLELFLVGK